LAPSAIDTPHPEPDPAMQFPTLIYTDPERWPDRRPSNAIA
jgi:hypothetical protein